MTVPPTSTVLLVHGAHMAGWSWLLVMDQLARRGIPARAVDLPFTGYEDDVAAVRAAIAVDPGPVHVVCHSYAGLPVAAGGHEAAHLTFVAARLPRPGESPAELTPRWWAPGFRSCMQTGDDGQAHLLPEAAPHLFHRTAPALAALAMERVRPMRSAVPERPPADPAWLSVPSSYVVCADDRAVRPEAQRERARLTGDPVELPADHSPFLSCPELLADVIAVRHRARACPANHGARLSGQMTPLAAPCRH